MRSASTVQFNEGEQALRERFDLREEIFEHRGRQLRMLLPRAADELLDAEAFERDERLPYWADLWPSARALARHLADQPPGLTNGQNAIELGCGLALPALMLRSQDVEIVASDHNEDALTFASANAHRNGIDGLKTRLLDWRAIGADVGPFDLAIAADVLYEQRNTIALLDCLPKLLRPGGRFILSDPDRRWAGEFRRRMRSLGWRERELAIVEEPSSGGNGRGGASLVEITEWTIRRT